MKSENNRRAALEAIGELHLVVWYWIIISDFIGEREISAKFKQFNIYILLLLCDYNLDIHVPYLLYLIIKLVDCQLNRSCESIVFHVTSTLYIYFTVSLVTVNRPVNLPCYWLTDWRELKISANFLCRQTRTQMQNMNNKK